MSFITLLRSITLDLVLLATCRMSGMISFSMHSLLIPLPWPPGRIGCRQYTFNFGILLAGIRNDLLVIVYKIILVAPIHFFAVIGAQAYQQHVRLERQRVLISLLPRDGAVPLEQQATRRYAEVSYFRLPVRVFAIRDTQQSSFLTPIPAVMLSPRQASFTAAAQSAGRRSGQHPIHNKTINFFME
ncbi:MAG: hypothetical protein ACLT8E_07770 [Akkermansia sp.]